MKFMIPAGLTTSNLAYSPDVAPPAFENRNIEDMTLRDWMALSFMLQMANAGQQTGDAPLAQKAVKRADALMIELERTEP